MFEYASNRLPLMRLAETGGVLAVITEISGASYRDLGTMMAISPAGVRTGSLSSGCIEDDIAEQAAETLKTGRPRSLRYGDGSPYFDLKLPCGGGLTVLLIPDPDREILAKVLAQGAARQDAILAIGRQDGAMRLLTRRGEAGEGEIEVAIEPELRFWVFGHGIEAISFALMAQAAGYDVALFGQEELQADLTRLGPLTHVPVTSFRSFRVPEPDQRTAVLLFFHDHDHEAHLLAQVLPSPAFFIGAQGSRKARLRLLDDLKARGTSDGHIARLCPDFGLIRSCRDPRTLAVSVLAHVLAVAASHAASYPQD